MQSVTSSNSILTFSPKLSNQLPKSAITQLPMVHQIQNKTVIKGRGSVEAAYVMSMITPTTSLLCIDEEMTMSKCIEVLLQVHEDEVDESGQVKECVYSNYCQQGHCELLKNVGLALGGAFTSTSLSNYTSKIHTPLQKGDEFAVKVKVSCTSTTSIYVETYIYRLSDNKIILESEAEIVLLRKDCRPANISHGVRAKLLFLDSFDLFE